MNRIIYKKRNAIKRKLSSLLRLHPSSYPFISGDTFRSLADHVFDEDTSFKPLLVKNKNIVFVQSSLLKVFFSRHHPYIEQKYILVSHNGDTNIDDDFIPYIDKKIIHWFAQNCLVKNEKLTPIPIGIENKRLYHNGILEDYEVLRKEKTKKNFCILCAFNIATNPTERCHAKNILLSIPVTKNLKKWLGQNDYLAAVKTNAFIASPAGNGYDCHRTWEALYLDTIPIVKKSVASNYFKEIGLPILTIDDWDELSTISSRELEKIYTQLSTEAGREEIWADYWFKKIKNFTE